MTPLTAAAFHAALERYDVNCAARGAARERLRIVQLIAALAQNTDEYDFAARLLAAINDVTTARVPEVGAGHRSAPGKSSGTPATAARTTALATGSVAAVAEKGD